MIMLMMLRIKMIVSRALSTSVRSAATCYRFLSRSRTDSTAWRSCGETDSGLTFGRSSARGLEYTGNRFKPGDFTKIVGMVG